LALIPSAPDFGGVFILWSAIPTLCAQCLCGEHFLRDAIARVLQAF